MSSSKQTPIKQSSIKQSPAASKAARPPASPRLDNDETPATEFIDLPANLPGSHE